MEQRSLPGMEDLISNPKGKARHPPSVLEIQSMVKDILAKEEQNEAKRRTSLK